MTKAKLTLLTCIFALMFSCIYPLVSIAKDKGKPSVVLFCTTWKYSCREAKSSLKEIVNSYDGKVEFKELDLDLASTPEYARTLDLSIPRTIPYVVVLNKDNDVIKKFEYKPKDLKGLKKQLDKLTK